MANLIIKPSAGGDLVIKSSDASPAITVGTTGQATFAENATLSGTGNNLGTTTAGTLTSGVTFPSGHVIQTLKASTALFVTFSGDTSYHDLTGLSKAITVGAGNKVLVMTTFQSYHGYAGQNIMARLIRGSTVIQAASDFYHPSGGGVSGNIAMTALDTPGTGSFTYKVDARSPNSEVWGINKDYQSSLNGIATLIVMEIQG